MRAVCVLVLFCLFVGCDRTQVTEPPECRPDITLDALDPGGMTCGLDPVCGGEMIVESPHKAKCYLDNKIKWSKEPWEGVEGGKVFLRFDYEPKVEIGCIHQVDPPVYYKVVGVGCLCLSEQHQDLCPDTCVDRNLPVCE